MRNIVLVVMLLAFAGAGFAEGTTKYVELAGTVVFAKPDAMVLKSNGKVYILNLAPDQPGVSSLKSGMAIIAKGNVTTVVEPDNQKRRTLSPSELIIRGRSYSYPAEVLPQG